MKTIFCFLIFIFGMNTYSQMTVKDPFEDLIAGKTKYNAGVGVAERWKYQTFSGSLDAAKNAYVDFRKEYRQIDATIVFAQPNYKVWSGNTRTRIECERLMDSTRKTFLSAFIVKPKN
jgi:hypothetical protein